MAEFHVSEIVVRPDKGDQDYDPTRVRVGHQVRLTRRIDHGLSEGTQEVSGTVTHVNGETEGVLVVDNARAVLIATITEIENLTLLRQATPVAWEHAFYPTVWDRVSSDADDP